MDLGETKNTPVGGAALRPGGETQSYIQETHTHRRRTRARSRSPECQVAKTMSRPRRWSLGPLRRRLMVDEAQLGPGPVASRGGGGAI